MKIMWILIPNTNIKSSQCANQQPISFVPQVTKSWLPAWYHSSFQTSWWTQHKTQRSLAVTFVVELASCRSSCRSTRLSTIHLEFSPHSSVKKNTKSTVIQESILNLTYILPSYHLAVWEANGTRKWPRVLWLTWSAQDHKMCYHKHTSHCCQSMPKLYANRVKSDCCRM